MNKLEKLALLAAAPITWRPLLVNRTAATMEHVPMLRQLQPTTVIDVGANKGQFALAALLAGASQVLSFEPLGSEATRYRQNLGQRPNVKLFEYALGEEEGQATFHVADRPDSSSLLPLGEGQREAYNVVEDHAVTVQVRRLDAVLDRAALTGTVLLKIDVQGAEGMVIGGATGVLDAIDYVYAEASFIELYEGQIMAGELIAMLDKAGFSLRGIYNPSHSARFGATQADFLFASRASAKRSRTA
jgi:FkbM family methyltransferase